MKVISSYQKLKLRIAELEKENHKLEKAIYEDDFYILYNVKMEYQMCLDLDSAYMAGESNYSKPNNRELVNFAEAFTAELHDGSIPNNNPETKGLFSGHRYRKLGKINLDLLPDFLKKKKK